MERRRFLKTCVGIGAGLGGLYLGKSFFYPSPSDNLPSVKQIANTLYDSLSPSQRTKLFLPYDHPYRQYFNHGATGAGIPVFGDFFDLSQRKMIVDLMYAGLSPAGRNILPEQYFLNWHGLNNLDLIAFGSPKERYFQAMLKGIHLNLRLGGTNKEGLPFGGPQVYGDQRGNRSPGLPGNMYQGELALATEVFNHLSADQIKQAVLPTSPFEVQIEPRGSQAKLPGLKVSNLSLQNQARVTALIDLKLDKYPVEDKKYAWQCINNQGGVKGFYLSYYRDSEMNSSGIFQNFRLESSNAVMHFQGAPHVHAYINILPDSDTPFSLGEYIGTNPQVLEGENLRVFAEKVLRKQLQTDLAYLEPLSIPGRLRTGPIREGDIYVLESWQNRTAIVQINANQLTGDLATRLQHDSTALNDNQTLTIATNSFVSANKLNQAFGGGTVLEVGAKVRDVLIRHIKQHGFAVT